MGEVNFPGRQEEEFFLGEFTELDAVQGSTGDAWKAKVSLNELLVEFKLDTGADVTVISPSLYHSLQPTPSLRRTTRLLMGPCKPNLCWLGTFMAELQVQGKVSKEQVYVIEDLERPLLSRKPAELLKRISRFDSLRSDDYKSKVPQVVRRTRCHERQLLYHTQRRCQTFPSVSSKRSTLPLVTENQRRVGRDVGDRCHIQS